MSNGVLAAHTARNSGSILGVLRHEFQHAREILEIGSGNGQHATTFASELRHLSWQTSDLEENHATISRWLAGNSVANVLPPLAFDVRTAKTPVSFYDGVFSANSAHIMSARAVAKMFALIGECLRVDGTFCLYGPFRLNDEFNSPSNAAFDASLRGRDAAMGIRDLEELDGFAADNRLERSRLYAMPANNYLAIWKKRVGDKDANT
ncbi:MAG: DUF938 domain-containing protein [Woeseiaceae bacterium]